MTDAIPFFRAIPNQATRDRMMPYAQHVQSSAQALGVDPNFVFSQILAESSGKANAVGAQVSATDLARDRGLYQVNDKYKGSWGFAKADTRMDPIAATTQIMPHLKALSDRNGGNWAVMRAEYMRGIGAAKRLRDGEPPEKVFGKSPIALAQYRHFEGLQKKFGTKNIDAAEANITTVPAQSPVVPRQPLPGYLSPEMVDAMITAQNAPQAPLIDNTPVVSVDPFASVYPAEAAALAQITADEKAAAQAQVLAVQPMQEDPDLYS